jgi:hypothetical protein
MDNKILFHEYLNFRGLNVNELTGKQFAAIVTEYERDKDDFPLSNSNKVKNYLRDKTPDQALFLYRYIKSSFTSARSTFVYMQNKNIYRYPTIYIAAGNRCAGTWLKEILIYVLDGYRGHQAHTTGPNGGNFDLNERIARHISKKLYVICSHTPPKYSNKKIMDEYLKRYIATIRDPRDVVVSLYYHIKKYPCGPTSLWDYGRERNLPWPTLSRNILSQEKSEIISILIERIMPSVIDFMEGWVDYSIENNNIFIVKYEDLILNTCNVVNNILKFYETDVDENILINAINNLNPKNNKNIYINYSSGRVPENDKYYNQPHNDWDKHLTVNQQHALERMSYTFFAKAGYSV